MGEGGHLLPPVRERERTPYMRWGPPPAVVGKLLRDPCVISSQKAMLDAWCRPRREVAHAGPRTLCTIILGRSMQHDRATWRTATMGLYRFGYVDQTQAPYGTRPQSLEKSYFGICKGRAC